MNVCACAHIVIRTQGKKKRESLLFFFFLNFLDNLFHFVDEYTNVYILKITF